MQLFNNVLKTIKPNKKQQAELEKFSSKLLKVSYEILKKSDVKPMFCGSTVKGTWLSWKHDIDLFLLFNPKVSRKNLQESGLKFAKQIVNKMKGKYTIAYAEHPYVKSFIGKYKIDIVPCFDIKDPSQIKSAVDRTPHHVKYIIENLKNPDDARLFKQFCISNQVYGADVRNQGFSGYLCELLILYYKNFQNLIKETSKWRAGEVISFENINKKSVFEKFRSPLVVIDPVDPNRNVAAAVSIESFYKFVKASKEFHDKPNYKFFFRERQKPYKVSEISKEINKRGTRWYLIKFKKPDVVEDTLYPQLRKSLNAVDKILTSNGFRILRKDFWVNDSCFLVLEMDIWQVPHVAKNVGPNVYSTHADEFLRHYKDHIIYIEDENWVVEKEREYIVVSHMLNDLISQPEKKLLEKGISSKIASVLRNSKVYSAGEFIKALNKMPEDFRIFMRQWFEKDLNFF